MDGNGDSVQHIDCGVPQNLFLGPLLLSLYVNDIVATIVYYNYYFVCQYHFSIFSSTHPDIASKL